MVKYKKFKVTLAALQKGVLIVKARTQNEVLNKYLDNKLHVEDIEVIDDGQWELDGGIDAIEEIEEVSDSKDVLP